MSDSTSLRKDPLLDARDLVKHYPVKASGFVASKEKVHALNSVSFTIDANETMGLVGESGCGKTTTGKVLLKVIQPDNGRLYFDLQDARRRAELEELEKLERLQAAEKDAKRSEKLEAQVKRLAAEIDFFSYPKERFKRERLKMQYIFQDPYLSLNPKMQIREIVTEPLVQYRIIKRREIDSHARELLDIVGIAKKDINKYPHEFSGGQRQRISIARAISAKPKLVICDEPVSSLDVSIQSQILNLLINIQDEFNISYLFIAHNLAVVFYMSDTIVVMYTGKIVEQAPSKTLYENPLHPYTKLLLSVIPEIGKKKSAHTAQIKGEVPSLIRLPRGCTFYDRCPQRMDVCLEEFPPLREVRSGSREVPGASASAASGAPAAPRAERPHLCACYAVARLTPS